MAYFETSAGSSDGWEPIMWSRAVSEFGPAWANQPAVRKVVGFIARQLASTPLHIYERSADNDRRRVRDGALYELLKRPSRAPGVTPYRFWEAWLIDGLLNDRAVARLAEGVDSPLELVRIPARMVGFRHDPLGRIEKLRIDTGKGPAVERDPADYLIDVGYAERGAGGTSRRRAGFRYEEGQSFQRLAYGF